MSINIQIVSKSKNIPSKADLKKWLNAALQKNMTFSEICIRIVDEPDMIELNKTYRHKKGSTNVLSFDYREKNESNHIFGDIIICVPVVEREAKKQSTFLKKHWAHMVIHGCLHLQGFDHQTDQEAQKMKQIETEILNILF